MQTRFICPVPLNQRPLNEYKSVKILPFLSWPCLSLTFYKSKLIKIFFVLSIIFLGINFNYFPILVYPVKYSILIFIYSNFTIILIFFKIFLDWYYLKNRLATTNLFYEESSWYDGEIWLKPKKILIQDYLLNTYQIYPILNRIKNTILFFLSLNIILICSFLLFP